MGQLLERNYGNDNNKQKILKKTFTSGKPPMKRSNQ